jgi:hypothetical protein
MHLLVPGARSQTALPGKVHTGATFGWHAGGSSVTKWNKIAAIKMLREDMYGSTRRAS